MGPVGMQIRTPLPAAGLDVGDEVTAGQQILPEQCWRGAGQPKRCGDYRYFAHEVVAYSLYIQINEQDPRLSAVPEGGRPAVAGRAVRGSSAEIKPQSLCHALSAAPFLAE